MTKQELEALLHEIRDLPVDDFAVAGRVASITAQISEELDRLRAAAEPRGELAALRAIADKAEPMLLEQRREFPRGELRDLDELEDALNAWRAENRQAEPRDERVHMVGDGPARMPVRWQAFPGAECVAWRIYIGTTQGGTDVLAGLRVPRHQLTMTIGGLKAGKYYVGISAVSQTGEEGPRRETAIHATVAESRGDGSQWAGGGWSGGPAIPFTHWSKDPLVPYNGCECSSCKAARNTENRGDEHGGK